jgi:hypothetical protein
VLMNSAIIALVRFHLSSVSVTSTIFAMRSPSVSVYKTPTTSPRRRLPTPPSLPLILIVALAIAKT